MTKQYRPRFKPGDSVRAVCDSQFGMYQEGDTARVMRVDLDSRGIEEGLQVVFDDGRSLRVLPRNWEPVEDDQRAEDEQHRRLVDGELEYRAPKETP